MQFNSMLWFSRDSATAAAERSNLILALKPDTLDQLCEAARGGSNAHTALREQALTLEPLAKRDPLRRAGMTHRVTWSTALGISA